MPVTLFLFDIDGTLLRAGTEVHRQAFDHAYRTVYGVALSLDGVAAAGRTDTWLLAEPLRQAGVPQREIESGFPEAFDAMSTFVDKQLGSLKDRVLPGVPEVLSELRERGMLLGLLTGNLSRIAMAKMRHAGLAEFFQTGGFGEESATRSHLVPVALSNASEASGRTISPAESIVIGDTPMDVEAGKVHGTRTAGVATGPYSVEQLRETGADLVLESFAGPRDAVRRLLATGPIRS